VRIRKSRDTVATRFQDHFIARRNVIFEKATRMQEGGESAESFITSLYGLAEHCGFGTLHDELIRDRIVVGIRDTTLSEKLQMDPNLNLQKAVNAVRQSKAVKSQQTTERGVAKSSDDAIDVLKKSRCPQKGWGYKAHKHYSSYSDTPPVKPLSKIYSMLFVTVVLRKDTLNQCADLRLWMTFQTITSQAPESYHYSIQFLQKFPLYMEEASHGLLSLV